jgi:hypothetical protein
MSDKGATLWEKRRGWSSHLAITLQLQLCDGGIVKAIHIVLHSNVSQDGFAFGDVQSRQC